MRCCFRMRRAPPVAGADCWARGDPADTKPAGGDDGCEGLLCGRAAPRARWLVVRMLSRSAPAPDAPWHPPGSSPLRILVKSIIQVLFADLEPSVTVTEQNLADRVRYILRSNTFDVTELERLRRGAVPSSDENATAEDAAPQLAEQPANVDAAVNTPVLVDSNDDGTVTQELELE
ncbi:unnamed protein product [Parnassius apollo]|uniref:(apollo) hypothetical protein n=1 Tax=Parnassius apollo TaxID=110799 RepID=A0A8S3XQ83_PARAO|nr:unnamed protein product [Parnassius apollo]